MLDTTFHLAWLIPLFPLAAFLVILIFEGRSPAVSRPIAVFGVLLSAVLILFMFVEKMFAVLDGQPLFAEALVERWFALGSSAFPLGLYVDPLGLLLLAALSVACPVIFIYSLSVIPYDARCGRFFALLSLLAAALFSVFVFDGLLPVLIAWSGVDVCAYLLVTFRRRQPASRGGLWVFLLPWAGNLSLLLGLALLHAAVGSSAYVDAFSRQSLAALLQMDVLGLPASLFVAGLLFLGLMVKSAQFPFQVWLVRATEAPTPASTLIHLAATAIGGFLLIRLAPLWRAVAGQWLIPGINLGVVSCAGLFTLVLTAFFAATQRDIRWALSFALVGQLGYVFLALGMGATVAAVFHLVVILFCGMMLFLAAGSVIRGMTLDEGHDNGAFDPYDVFNMGGLGVRQPVTFYLFLFAGMALAGLPLVTAGFWSRDAILAHVWIDYRAIFWVLALASAVTGYGVMRQLGLIFVGRPRSRAAARAIESTPAMILPLLLLALFILVMGWAALPDDVPIFGGNWLAVFVGAETTRFAAESMVMWSALTVVGFSVGFLVYALRDTPAGEEEDWVALQARALRLRSVYMGLRHSLYLDWVYRALGRLSILGGQALSLGDRLLDVGAIQALRWLGQNASRACGWIDGCVLTPAFHPIDRAAAPLAWAVGWLDRRMAPALGVLVHLGRYPARVAGLFDRWLDGGLMVVKPAVMGLVSLSAVVERGLSRAVDAVGGAVRASRPWLQPRTGRVQSYLRLAFASLVVLMAVLSVFLLI